MEGERKKGGKEEGGEGWRWKWEWFTQLNSETERNLLSLKKGKEEEINPCQFINPLYSPKFYSNIERFYPRYPRYP